MLSRCSRNWHEPLLYLCTRGGAKGYGRSATGRTADDVVVTFIQEHVPRGGHQEKEFRADELQATDWPTVVGKQPAF